ncbi:Fpg/Nei family DNA glycosylase [Nitriliruptor alkaliphilus]|uniref:Fpg/Nei family DNA glycosylase n=1 Tax=Nitriliruptor alkaliphilus TaxID=427918 RepID=UPI0006978F17|nr:DNA-formamidopyrimidine glycosylase family protein [Nitriliruptor alkaliphilus]
MPELPDVEDYRAALIARVVGATLTRVRVQGISLLKTYDPPVDALHGRVCGEVRRVGKRLVFGFPGEAGEEDLFAVLHLMIAGRLAWAEPGAKVPGKVGLAAFDWSVLGDPDTPGGTLLLREAGTKKRASLHVERGEAAAMAHDRGGIEPLEADLEAFRAELTRERRTVKRALTDPRRFSGIGNAFSDEILHAAGLSPVKRTDQLDDEEVARLHAATQGVLTDWVARLRERTGDGFPEKVTAFREEFAVHGKYGQPCPVCDAPVQRIRYADNETDYCARCQTGGKVLADRSLSRLLKDDWPKTVDQLEGA